tara:strand:+ start:2334 stop:2639 length:306 start_codon:yes stop_codon:yes gene_type:complete
MTSGVTLQLRVTPKSATARIGDIGEDAAGRRFLRVYVREVPDKGKANDAVIKLLAKSWGLPKSGFAIRSGASERNKTISIAGDPDQLMAALAPLFAPDNEE